MKNLDQLEGIDFTKLNTQEAMEFLAYLVNANEYATSDELECDDDVMYEIECTDGYNLDNRLTYSVEQFQSDDDVKVMEVKLANLDNDTYVLVLCQAEVDSMGATTWHTANVTQQGWEVIV